MARQESEGRRPPRRTILKMALAGVGLTALGAAPHVYVDLRRLSLKELRRARPEPLSPDADMSNLVFGVAPDRNGVAEALEIGHELVGRVPDITNLFYVIEGKNEGQALAAAWGLIEKGSVPMLSAGHEYYMRMSEREQRELMKRHAMKLAPFGEECLIRFFYEKNTVQAQRWFGGFLPSQYRRGWRVMHETLRAEGVRGKFVFSPNWVVEGASFEPYWPGPKYVDVTGGDFYRKYSPHWWDPEHYLYGDVTVEDMLGPDMRAMQKLAPNHPYLLTEINAIDFLGWGEMYRQAAFMVPGVAYAIEHGACGYVGFNRNKAEENGEDGSGEVGEANWEYNPETVKGLRVHMSGYDYFKGTGLSGRERAAKVIRVMMAKPLVR